MQFLDRIPWMLVVALCATLGLAPFTPKPHLWEKLKKLAAGDLRGGADIFDLGFHALPWLLLVAKAACIRGR